MSTNDAADSGGHRLQHFRSDVTDSEGEAHEYHKY